VLPDQERDDDGAESLASAWQALEHRMVTQALLRHGGRRTHAARELGLSRQGLAKAIRRLGLQPRAAPL
jgi:DNA-binding NtrC family response regulator